MASELFIDLASIDLDRRVADVEAIEADNPQRGHMRHLDGIVYLNDAKSLVVGFKEVRDDEFWVEGHIPGRPLLPGVLMIEAAAQLAAWIMKQRIEGLGFVGFLGCDGVKFRNQVVPGQRLYLIGQEVKFSKRRCVCRVQGVVDGALVFEATITGYPL